MALRFGLVGEDLSRSPSRAIHRYVFQKIGVDADYDLFQIKRDEAKERIPGLLAKLYGLNVTMPYKEEVASLLYANGSLSDEAMKAFSVNTVQRLKDHVKGYNTDYVAVKRILKRLSLGVGNRCLLIGAGGAARAAALALGELGFRVSVVNRSQERAQHLVEHMRRLGFDFNVFTEFNGEELVVNAVPPEPRLGFRPKAYVDFSYTRPAELGSQVNVGGDEILVAQALEADSIWLGSDVEAISEEEVLDVVRQFLWKGH
ncbi:shikimate dehydrogenase [Tardisphaera miroshnichenkoae]